MEFIFLVATLVLLGLALLRLYMNGGSCRFTKRLDGKTIIVTGANTGIGKITAQVLAARGARVILACRNVDAAQKAVEWIRSSGMAGIAGAQLEVKELDLADLDSVRKFSNDILSSEGRLDILINNAGVMRCPKLQTRQGFEMQYGVNHLGHFLLTNLLLPLLKQTGSPAEPARVINVSSLGHRRGKIDFADMNSDNKYDPRQAYCNSKLMNVLFTRELCRRLVAESASVVSTSLHPGVVRTDLGRHMAKSWSTVYYVAVVIPLASLFFKSPWQGAQTTIHTALSPTPHDDSGKYFADCKPARCTAAAQDDEVAARLWEVSEKACGL